MNSPDRFEGLTRPPNGEEMAHRFLLGARILIVEDNPFIASALEEMLTEQGLVVIGVARTVNDALRLSEAPKIDLALLDVKLGEEKIDSVAEALSARHTPFVFATGYGRAGLPERFRNRPMVEKPFYVEEILRTLRTALQEVAPENV